MTKYILLDTETTGTSDEDRIIQLGFIVLEGKNAVLHNDYCTIALFQVLKIMSKNKMQTKKLKR